MKIRPFELALIIIFGGLGLLAILILSVWQPPPETEVTDAQIIRGEVHIWGTVPETVMSTVLRELRDRDDKYDQVTYRFLDAANFNAELTVALADGIGPDLIFTSHEELTNQRKRIYAIDYESYPLRDVRNTYIEGAHIYALNDGLYAFPVMIDPLMLFWNRDILANEGLLEPPTTWENLINAHVPRLTDRTFDRTINRSAVAMGEYSNTRNAFGALSALIIQGGSRMVWEQEEQYVIQLNTTVEDSASRPLSNAIEFYTRFSKPSDLLYTWNRSFAEDRQQFVSEDLVYYFGYGSEGPELERLNPNLNFDIAELPQGASAEVRRTYGRVYGVSALRSSDNLNSAFVVLATLGSTEVAERIAQLSAMVPARRESVLRGSNDIYGRLTYQSASVAYGWLNPAPPQAEEVFATMVSDVNENRRSVNAAANDAINRFRDMYK